MKTNAFVALGSNLGDRRAILAAAVDAMRQSDHVNVVAVSDFMATEPVGPPGQGTYLNAAAWLKTNLTPDGLMALLLGIEQQLGRTRSPDLRWGPRTLDLDLLLFGDRIIHQPGLSVPHPEMHRRAFVLVPLAQIASGQIHPVFKQSVQELLDCLNSGDRMECPRLVAGS